jgi:hypothetical protein
LQDQNDVSIKKATQRVAFSWQTNNTHHEIDDLYLEMFYLALSYFLRGLPPKYRRR